jgi:hypothetical protein
MARARAGVVDQARHELLAGAGVAHDMHRRLAARDLGDHGAQAVHGRRAAEQGAGAVGPGVPRGAQLEGGGDQLPEVLDLDRLGDEVVGAELERAHGRLDVAVGRDDRDRDAGRVALHPLHELEPVAVGQAHVGQAEMKVRRLQLVAGLGEVDGGVRQDVHALERHREQLADVGFVVDDQDGGLGHSGLPALRVGEDDTKNTAPAVTGLNRPARRGSPRRARGR